MMNLRIKILFVSLIVFAFAEIQPSVAAKQDKNTVYRPDFAAGSRTISLTRNKDKDYGYSFEFDVDKEGRFNNIKTLTPRNADQRISEALLTTNKLPTPIPMKNSSSSRRLKLILLNDAFITDKNFWINGAREQHKYIILSFTAKRATV